MLNLKSMICIDQVLLNKCPFSSEECSYTHLSKTSLLYEQFRREFNTCTFYMKSFNPIEQCCRAPHCTREHVWYGLTDDNLLQKDASKIPPKRQWYTSKWKEALEEEKDDLDLISATTSARKELASICTKFNCNGGLDGRLCGMVHAKVYYNRVKQLYRFDFSEQVKFEQEEQQQHQTDPCSATLAVLPKSESHVCLMSLHPSGCPYGEFCNERHISRDVSKKLHLSMYCPFYNNGFSQHRLGCHSGSDCGGAHAKVYIDKQEKCVKVVEAGPHQVQPPRVWTTNFYKQRLDTLASIGAAADVKVICLKYLRSGECNIEGCELFHPSQYNQYRSVENILRTSCLCAGYQRSLAGFYKPACYYCPNVKDGVNQQCGNVHGKALLDCSTGEIVVDFNTRKTANVKQSTSSLTPIAPTLVAAASTVPCNVTTQDHIVCLYSVYNQAFPHDVDRCHSVRPDVIHFRSDLLSTEQLELIRNALSGVCWKSGVTSHNGQQCEFKTHEMVYYNPGTGVLKIGRSVVLTDPKLAFMEQAYYSGAANNARVAPICGAFLHQQWMDAKKSCEQICRHHHGVKPCVVPDIVDHVMEAKLRQCTKRMCWYHHYQRGCNNANCARLSLDIEMDSATGQVYIGALAIAGLKFPVLQLQHQQVAQEPIEEICNKEIGNWSDVCKIVSQMPDSCDNSLFSSDQNTYYYVQRPKPLVVVDDFKHSACLDWLKDHDCECDVNLWHIMNTHVGDCTDALWKKLNVHGDICSEYQQDKCNHTVQREVDDDDSGAASVFCPNGFHWKVKIDKSKNSLICLDEEELVVHQIQLV